jgi:hypothetical protein
MIGRAFPQIIVMSQAIAFCRKASWSAVWQGFGMTCEKSFLVPSRYRLAIALLIEGASAGKVDGVRTNE